MTRVKVCGLQRWEDALVAVHEGADLLGLVFAPSRRQVPVSVAGELVRRVRSESGVPVVGVFVNASPTDMNAVVARCGLDYVQLSGDEPDDIVGGLDVPAIQVFHVHPYDDPSELADRVHSSSAQMVLLDTARAGSYGGTGTAFDWSLTRHVSRPFLLAGGLRVETVGDAIRHAAPWALDVSSGVERDGVKDPDLIRLFLQSVKYSATTLGK